MQQPLLSQGFRPVQAGYAPVPTLLHRPGAKQDLNVLPAPSLKAALPAPSLKPVNSERLPVQGQAAAAPATQRSSTALSGLSNGAPAERQEHSDSDVNVFAACAPAAPRLSRTVLTEQEHMRASSPVYSQGPHSTVSTHKCMRRGT